MKPHTCWAGIDGGCVQYATSDHVWNTLLASYLSIPESQISCGNKSDLLKGWTVQYHASFQEGQFIGIVRTKCWEDSQNSCMYQSLLSDHLRIGILTRTYTLDILLLLSNDISMYLVHRMCSGISNSDHYENHKIVREYPFTFTFFAVLDSGMLRKHSPQKNKPLPFTHTFTWHVQIFAYLTKNLEELQFVDCRCCLNFSFDLDAILTPPRINHCTGKTRPLRRIGGFPVTAAMAGSNPSAAPTTAPVAAPWHKNQRLGTSEVGTSFFFKKLLNGWLNQKPSLD